MRRKTTFGTFIFMIAFVISITLMNAFLVYRLNDLYGLNAYALFSFLSIITLFFPIALTLDQAWDSPFSRYAYLIDIVSIGVIFMIALVSFIEFILAYLFPLVASVSLYILPVVALVIILVSVIEAYRIKVRHFTLPIRGLEKPVRIVQFSDVHLGAVVRPAFLERVIQTVNRQKPDLVVVAGDLFDGTGNPKLSSISAFSKSSAPVYAVIGNHDLQFGADKAQRFMEHYGVKVLRGDALDVGAIVIAGLDCPLSGRSKDRNPKIKDFRHAVEVSGKPLVLVYHMPASFQDAEGAGASLMLTGHTHNGQIFPFHLFIRAFFKHIRGLHHKGDMWLYVSQGVGTGGPPMRLCSSSEVVVFDLKPA